MTRHQNSSPHFRKPKQQQQADNYDSVEEEGAARFNRPNRSRRLVTMDYLPQQQQRHHVNRSAAAAAAAEADENPNTFDRRAQTLLRFRAFVSSSGPKTSATTSRRQQQPIHPERRTQQQQQTSDAGGDLQPSITTAVTPENSTNVQPPPQVTNLFEHAFQCLDRLENALHTYTSAQIVVSANWWSQYWQFRKFVLHLISTNLIKTMHCKIWLRVWQVMVQQYLIILIEYQCRKAQKQREQLPLWKTPTEDRFRFYNFISDWIFTIRELRLALTHKHPLNIFPLTILAKQSTVHAARSRSVLSSAADSVNTKRRHSIDLDAANDYVHRERILLPAPFIEYTHNSVSDINDAWHISALVLDIDLAKSMRKLIQLKAMFFPDRDADANELEQIQADIIRCKARMSAVKVHSTTDAELNEGESLFNKFAEKLEKQRQQQQQTNTVTAADQPIFDEKVNKPSAETNAKSSPLQHHVMFDAALGSSSRSQFLSRLLSRSSLPDEEVDIELSNNFRNNSRNNLQVDREQQQDELFIPPDAASPSQVPQKSVWNDTKNYLSSNDAEHTVADPVLSPYARHGFLYSNNNSGSAYNTLPGLMMASSTTTPAAGNFSRGMPTSNLFARSPTYGEEAGDGGVGAGAASVASLTNTAAVGGNNSVWSPGHFFYSQPVSGGGTTGHNFDSGDFFADPPSESAAARPAATGAYKYRDQYHFGDGDSVDDNINATTANEPNLFWPSEYMSYDDPEDEMPNAQQHVQQQQQHRQPAAVNSTLTNTFPSAYMNISNRNQNTDSARASHAVAEAEVTTVPTAADQVNTTATAAPFMEDQFLSLFANRNKS